MIGVKSEILNWHLVNTKTGRTLDNPISLMVWGSRIHISLIEIQLIDIKAHYVRTMNIPESDLIWC